MSASPFGAAKPHVELRHRTAEISLPDVSPDDAHEDRQDYLWALDQEEQRRDRLDEHAGRPWPSAQVAALPVRAERRAAA